MGHKSDGHSPDRSTPHTQHDDPEHSSAHMSLENEKKTKIKFLMSFQQVNSTVLKEYLTFIRMVSL